MNQETNVINWVEAFKDEAFMRELRKVIMKVLEENTASDADITEIFKYDASTESIKINKDAFRHVVIKDEITEETNVDSEQLTDDNSEQLTDEEIDKITNNIKMMLILKLMKENGLKLDKNNMSGDKSKSVKHHNHGNGAKAAEILSVVTGIPQRTCLNFVSNQTLSYRGLTQIVDKINAKLIDLGLTIRLD